MRRNLDYHTTARLAVSKEPQGYIVHVSVDNEEVIAIWCDHIQVLGGRPPCYHLLIGSAYITSFSAKLLTVEPEAGGAITETAQAKLGRYLILKGAK